MLDVMNDEIIELTQDIVDELRYHVKRTGVGSTKLLNIFANQAPQDLSRSIVERVLRFKKRLLKKAIWILFLHPIVRCPITMILERPSHQSLLSSSSITKKEQELAQ